MIIFTSKRKMTLNSLSTKKSFFLILETFISEKIIGSKENDKNLHFSLKLIAFYTNIEYSWPYS